MKQSIREMIRKKNRTYHLPIYTPKIGKKYVLIRSLIGNRVILVRESTDAD